MIITRPLSNTLYNVINTGLLKVEIEKTNITIAIESISETGGTISIEFKANISAAEETTLDGVIAAHNGFLKDDATKTRLQNGDVDADIFATDDRIKVDVSGSLGNGKVSVTTNDTNADFLIEKIVAASSKLTFTVINPGGDEEYSVDVNAIDVTVGATDADKIIKTNAAGIADKTMVQEADQRITIVGDGVPDIILDTNCPTFGGFCIKKSNASGFMNYMPNAETSQIIFSSPTAASGVNRLFLDVDMQGVMYLNTLGGAGAGAEVVATNAAPLRPSGNIDSDLGTNAQKWRNVFANAFLGDGSQITNILTSNINNFATEVQNAQTVTTLSFNNTTKVLTYTNEAGTPVDVDLTQFLDDTNLARITSGVLNATTGIATFTRDDTTTFDVDFSSLNDQAFINGAISTHETTIGNHNDVNITSPQEGDCLCYQGGQWVNVTDYKASAQRTDGLINQSSNVYSQYLRLNFTVPTGASGEYKLTYNIQWSLNTTGSDHDMRIELNDTTEVFRQVVEPQDSGGTGITLPVVGGGSTSTGTNQRFTKSGTTLITLSDGAGFLDLDWRGNVANTEATIYNATMFIERFI